MSQQPPGDGQPWNPQQPPNYSQPLYGPPPQPGYPGQAPLPYQAPYAPQGQVPPRAKKPRRWPWIVAIFVALVIGYGAGSAGHSSTATPTTPAATQAAPTQAAAVTKPTNAPTAKPTTAPKPKAPAVLFQQTGNGELTTKSFTAPGSWTLSWSCTPDATVGDAPLYINVEDGTGTDTFNGDISATCKVGNASGSSQESQAGTVSLHIISGIDWTVKAVAA